MLVSALACSPPPADFLLGGIQVNEPDMHVWHARLLEHGFDTVSLTEYARQYAWDSADLRFRAPEESDTYRELRAARAAGLRAALVLRVELDDRVPANRFLWHGLVMPRDEAELAEWFEHYGRFVLAWAELAEREGVELFGIASELTALTSTGPLAGLPVLEEYYLNEEKQALERARLLQAEGEVDDEHLGAKRDESSSDLGAFLDERTAAQAAWARQVTGGGDLEWVRRRRALLERHWRELIADVREVYRGRLTYAANFDQYQAVGFWDDLDVVGINAYFPLRPTFVPGEDPRAVEPVLEASWRRILGELRDWRRERRLGNRPVVFTELGYTPRAGSTVNPWAGTGFAVLGGEPAAGTAAGGSPGRIVVWSEQPVAPLERAAAVRALRRAAREVAPGLLQGLLWWKLSTVPAHRAIEPFLVVLEGREAGEDPVVSELRALAGRD